MTRHMSVRILWHDSGWNGCICKHPRRNTYCYADKSVPINQLKDKKHDPKYQTWEDKNASKPFSELDRPPRCTWSSNAFSPEPTQFVHIAQDFMKARDSGIRDFPEAVPPFSMGTWKFDDMYPTRFRGFANVDIYTPFFVKQREQLSSEYFKQFEPGKSLVFTYLNTDNPLNSERETYVLVGVCKLKEMGKPQRWSFARDSSHEHWGDLVWSRRISQSYSVNEGLRIPYQEVMEYQESHSEVGDLLSPILFEIDNGKEIVRKFKYVSRDLTDIEAAAVIEQLFPIVKKLKEYQKKYGICRDIDWDLKEEWLSNVLADTYKERSRYPGIVAVLDCLHFKNAMLFFNEVLKKKENEGINIKEYLRKLLEEDAVEKGYENELENAKDYWRTYSPEEQNFMLDVLSLIDFRTTMTFESPNGTEVIVKNQIEKIMDKDRETLAGIKSQSKELVENPYSICEEYRGQEPDDFITFDRIDAAFFPNEVYLELDPALRMDRNDPRRVRARIVQILKSQRGEGHCFLNIRSILEKLNKSDDLAQRISVTLRDLRAKKEFYCKTLFWKPVEGEEYLYLKEVHEMEEMIEGQVRGLIDKGEIPSPKVEWSKLLKRPDDSKFPSKVLEKVWKEKSSALENSFRNSFSVITGIAGSGKTTLLEALIKIICRTEKASLADDFILLAPTGKAAIRLSDVGKRAFTIDFILHKKKWANPYLRNTYMDKGEKIHARNIIIDECSMIDLEKLSILFKAIDWEGIDRLILVGDVNQLPPIGLGKPFFDIIKYLKNSDEYKERNLVSYLATNCRQILKDSQAAKLAGIFMSREEEDPFWEEMLLKILTPCKLGRDLEVCYWEDEMDLPDLIYEKINEIAEEEFEDYSGIKDYECFNRLIGAKREGLNEELGVDNRYSVDFFQIITPYRQNFFGVTDLNYRIQHRYHSKLWSYIPGKRAASHGRVDDFTHFDRIIQVNNRYRQWFQYDYKSGQQNVIIDFLANGQLGISRIWNDRSRKRRHLQLEYQGIEDKLLKATKNFAKNHLELAYVLTIHKVQGSQFNVLIVIIPEKQALISKELMYTALTRQLDKLIILIQNSAKYHLLRAKTNSSILNRNSSIFFHYDVKTPSTDLRKRLTENHIHRTNRSDRIELVISKSEVIIANLLLEAEIPYEYERVLDCPDFPVKPDFTILNHKGEPVLYWEHLGMLGKEDYDRKWERKRQGYEKNGYKIITKEELKDVGTYKLVLTTKERKGAIDSIEIRNVIDGIRRLKQRSS